MDDKKEIVLFETKDKRIFLPVSIENDTVWLSANQMSLLFERDEKTIRKHINNVFTDEELNKENNTQKMRVDGVKQPVPFYTLDVIISVGYRVSLLLHHLPVNLRRFIKNSVGLGHNTKNENSAGKPVISRFEGL